MEKRQEIRDFLVSRRARVTPEQAGLPDFGGERRVPGLRREEVALLAGVSVDYYSRLERGRLPGASDSVLEAIARTLLLDEAERAHLFDLARTIQSPRARRAPQRVRPGSVRGSIQRTLDGMRAPAVVRNARLDLVAANDVGRALYLPLFDVEEGPANIARFIFLDARSRDFYIDWDGAGQIAVAMLRIEAGRDPLDADLTGLIGELSTRSRAFRELWARHDVHLHHTGFKHFQHPVVGRLDLVFDAFDLPADPGLAIDTFGAEPGTPTEDALRMLESWVATRQTETGPRGQTPVDTPSATGKRPGTGNA